jgi:tRNA pseudouridine38-40 synthase
MPRYFLELSYKGTNYSGFQVQENAKTVQWEMERALETLYRVPLSLTGSSRTDSGVHARQNFFHLDFDHQIRGKEIYNLNAILPADISATAYYAVDPDAHCRFGAEAREYKYFIYSQKNPFLDDRAWYYPFTINHQLLTEAAQLVAGHTDFIAFSKRNTQVNNFRCTIHQSAWVEEAGCLVYHVKANRFLRGMVRALVSSMLRVGRGTVLLDDFRSILETGTQSAADFSAPAHGLFLEKVHYPEGYLRKVE